MSDFDKIHTNGLDNGYAKASVGEPVTGTQTAAPGRTEYIVGLQTLEVGKSIDSMETVSVSDAKQKLKIKTQSAEEVEVMGQMVYHVDIEHENCNVNFHTTGNVIQAIAEKLTSSLKYGASNMQADFYLKISKATEDQLTNSEGKTIKAFMINDDDFITYRVSFETFIKEFADNVKGASETVLPLGSVQGMLPESYKVGFCPGDNDANKATVALNFA
jgi:hypothetical protein